MDFLLPHILYPLNICCGQLFTKQIHECFLIDAFTIKFTNALLKITVIEEG